jgi:uncharacterized protein
LLILLPPSETKQLGGDPGLRADYPFAELANARADVRLALESLCSDLGLARKILKFNDSEQLRLNLELATGARMPAALRYTGVLYSALDALSLGAQATRQLGSQVLIQSSLLGLIPALTPIPWYRLSANTSLPCLNLKKTWSKAHAELWVKLPRPVIDMRSKAYQQLAPIPPHIESFEVDVLDADSGRALNHFNKKAKGAFTRAAAAGNLDSVNDLSAAAERAGLGFRLTGKRIQLLVPGGF